MKRRAGKSLVELLLIINLLGVLLALVAVTLVAMMRTERQIRRDLDQHTTLARLASRWRTDCHAASAADVTEACELTLADGRKVRYAAEGSRIVRQVMDKDNVGHRDAFTLPAGAVIQFAAPEEFRGRLVRLAILPGAEPGKPFGTAVRGANLEAALGSGGILDDRP